MFIAPGVGTLCRQKAHTVREGRYFPFRSIGPHILMRVSRAVAGETQLHGVAKPNHPMNLFCSYVTCMVLHCAVGVGTYWVRSPGKKSLQDHIGCCELLSTLTRIRSNI